MIEKKLTPSGAKAVQRNDDEWRAKPYSEWHRTLDKSLLALDVDYIEWRFKDGNLYPVAVIEVTRTDKGKVVNNAYLNTIRERFEVRDLQGRAAVRVATALGVKAFIVLFREDCSEFWLYNLSDRKGWCYFTPLQMEEFLLKLEDIHNGKERS